MEQLTTNEHYNYKGELSLKSEIDLADILPRDGAVCEITTYKSTRCVITSAQVGFNSENCFSFVMFQDFNSRLQQIPSARVTKKLLESAHAEAIKPEKIRLLIDEIKTHYKVD